MGTLTPKTTVTDIKCQRVHGSDTASFPLKPCGHLHCAHSGQIHSNLQWHHQQFLWAGRQNLMSQSCLLLTDYCAVKQTSLFLLIICISFCELPTYVLCPFKIYVRLSFALLHFMGRIYIVCYISCKYFLLDWPLSFNFSNRGFHSIEVLKFHVIKNVQSFPLWFRDSRRTSLLKVLQHSSLWCFD